MPAPNATAAADLARLHRPLAPRPLRTGGVRWRSPPLFHSPPSKCDDGDSVRTTTMPQNSPAVSVHCAVWNAARTIARRRLQPAAGERRRGTSLWISSQLHDERLPARLTVTGRAAQPASRLRAPARASPSPDARMPGRRSRPRRRLAGRPQATAGSLAARLAARRLRTSRLAGAAVPRARRPPARLAAFGLPSSSNITATEHSSNCNVEKPGPDLVATPVRVVRRIAIVGGGGRHPLPWKMSQSPLTSCPRAKQGGGAWATVWWRRRGVDDAEASARRDGICVLDIRLANAGRHAGNILTCRDEQGHGLSLVPIDHGYRLPESPPRPRVASRRQSTHAPTAPSPRQPGRLPAHLTVASRAAQPASRLRAPARASPSPDAQTPGRRSRPRRCLAGRPQATAGSPAARLAARRLRTSPPPRLRTSRLAGAVAPRARRPPARLAAFGLPSSSNITATEHSSNCNVEKPGPDLVATPVRVVRRIAIVGGGGRHPLPWKMSQSPLTSCPRAKQGRALQGVQLEACGCAVHQKIQNHGHSSRNIPRPMS
uniref:1-phosphatidylinositol 4-kinase n=1 Tax=Oryza sativa subsp. japonica TaxID=39947 RepID=Q6ZGH5_ORYSJ|nr:hypothetical protein [Oryza sativa Japonica Group]